MKTAVLAKSRPSSRVDSLGGVMGEDFDGAIRSLHYPLTPEVSFGSIKELRTGLEVVLKKLHKDRISLLSIHGHGARYTDGVAIEMGDDILHHSTIDTHSVELAKIGRLMAPDGMVDLLHCFAGSAWNLIPKMARHLGVRVRGENELNNLTPVLVPAQTLLLKVIGSEIGVRTGRTIYSP